MSPRKLNVSEAAQQYFSNINPIASRIYADFEETKSSYDCVWKTLSFEEQSQILNECIIKPEVTFQYNLKAIKDKNGDVFARKRVVDENMSYRDEHSAPFSFKTLSQIDLRIFTPKLEPVKVESQQSSSTTPPLIKPSSTKLFSRLSNTGVVIKDFLGATDTSEEYQVLISSPQSSADTATSETGTTLVDLDGKDTSPEALSINMELIDEGEFKLPKTGLDFLDNW